MISKILVFLCISAICTDAYRVTREARSSDEDLKKIEELCGKLGEGDCGVANKLDELDKEQEEELKKIQNDFDVANNEFKPADFKNDKTREESSLALKELFDFKKRDAEINHRNKRTKYIHDKLLELEKA